MYTNINNNANATQKFPPLLRVGALIVASLMIVAPFASLPNVLAVTPGSSLSPSSSSTSTSSNSLSNLIPIQAVKCPSGTSFNLLTRMCNGSPTCPTDTTLNQATEKCEGTVQPTCASGTTGAINGGVVCQTLPVCSSGTYNPQTDSCEQTLQSEPICPETSTLNPLTHKCESPPPLDQCIAGAIKQQTSDGKIYCVIREPNAQTPCPQDYTHGPDFNPNACVKQIICPTGMSIDPADGLCKGTINENPSCSTGTFNAATNKCEQTLFSAASCNQGTLDPTTDKCESNPTLCPSGYSLNSGTGLCQISQVVTCPSGTSLNSSQEHAKDYQLVLQVSS